MTAPAIFFPLPRAPPLADVRPVALLRKITKLMIVHTKAKAHLLLQKQQTDVALSMDFLFFFAVL